MDRHFSVNAAVPRLGWEPAKMASPAPGHHLHHLSFPFPSPTLLKTGTRFPTWCWEHLRFRFLQQLHGELEVVSAELEDKATKRKAQCPCRGGTLQGRFLLHGWWEPIPWGSPRPPGLLRHQDPWESCSAWRDLPFFDWCPTLKRMFLPARWKTGEGSSTFPRNTWVSAGCGTRPAPPALQPNDG